MRVRRFASGGLARWRLRAVQVLLYDGIRRLTTRRVESRSDPVSPIRGFGLTGVPFFRVAPRGDL